MALIIRDDQNKVTVEPDWEEKLNDVAKVALEQEDVDLDAEISLVFADNESIRELNKTYRSKDSATDVLSFPLWDPEEEEVEEILLGDIIISLERAVTQAEEYGHSLEREVTYLMVHGILHLVGYDHLVEEDKKIMREHEEKILKAVKVFR